MVIVNECKIELKKQKENAHFDLFRKFETEKRVSESKLRLLVSRKEQKLTPGNRFT